MCLIEEGFISILLTPDVRNNYEYGCMVNYIEIFWQFTVKSENIRKSLHLRAPTHHVEFIDSA